VNNASKKNKHNLDIDKAHLMSDVDSDFEADQSTAFELDWNLYLQILLHPFQNAVKFSQRGSRILIQTELVLIKDESGRSNLYLKTSVLDSGEGISKAALRKLCLLFQDFQGEEGESILNMDSGKSFRSGIGLGLFAAYKLTEYLGG